jgi:hypothetical protein
MANINRKDAELAYKLVRLTEIETRKFINFLFNKYIGTAWVEYIPQKILCKVEQLVGQEKYRSVIKKPETFLMKTLFFHLKEIIIENYDRFSGDLFLEKKEIEKLYNYLNEHRREVAHSQDITEEVVNNLILCCNSVYEINKHFFKSYKQLIDNFIEIDNEEEFLFEKLYLKKHNIPLEDDTIKFIGRDEEKRGLIAAFKGAANNINMYGVGGVGKTSLLKSTLKEVIANFNNYKFDYIVWLSAKNDKLNLEIEEITPALKEIRDIYESIIALVYYGEDLTTFRKRGISFEKEELKEYFQEVLEEFKIILVIDNYETVIEDEEILEFVRSFNLINNSKVITTSRISIETGIPIRIAGLNKEDAVKLFDNVFLTNDWDNSFREELLTIQHMEKEVYIKKVDRNPLGIIWAINVYKSSKNDLSLNDIFNNSKKEKSELVKFCFQNMITKLNEDELKILYTLAYLDEPIKSSLIALYLDINKDDVTTLLNKLFNLSLVEKIRTNASHGICYSIHELAKDYLEKGTEISDNVKYIIHENYNNYRNIIQSYEMMLIKEYDIDEELDGELLESLSEPEDKIYCLKAMDIFKKAKEKEITLDEAIEEVEKILKVNKHQEIYLILAMLQSRQGRHNNIIMNICDDDKLNKNSRVWRIYGEIEKNRMNYEKKSLDIKFNGDARSSAIDKFRHSLQLKETVKANMSLARCLMHENEGQQYNLNDLKEALEIIEKVLGLPSSGSRKKIYILLSETYRRISELEAEKNYKVERTNLEEALKWIREAKSACVDESILNKEVRIMNALAENWLNENLEFSEAYAKDAISFSKRSKVRDKVRDSNSKRQCQEKSTYYCNIIESNKILFKIYQQKRDIPKALLYYETALTTLLSNKGNISEGKYEKYEELLEKFLSRVGKCKDDFKDRGIIKCINSRNDKHFFVVLSLNVTNNNKNIFGYYKAFKEDMDIETLNYIYESGNVIEYILLNDDIKNRKNAHEIVRTDKFIDIKEREALKVCEIKYENSRIEEYEGEFDTFSRISTGYVVGGIKNIKNNQIIKFHSGSFKDKYILGDDPLAKINEFKKNNQRVIFTLKYNSKISTYVAENIKLKK